MKCLGFKTAVAAIGYFTIAMSALANVDVTVQSRTTVSVNGYRSIESQIFGLTAYQGAADFDPYWNTSGYTFLNTWGCGSVGMPGMLNWVFDPNASAFTLDQIDPWFDDGTKAWRYFSQYYGGDRYTYGRILPNIRTNTKAEPWLYILGSSPQGLDSASVPTDFAIWTETALRYVGLALNADPNFTYCHILNESNATWANTGHNGTDYVNLFSQAATGIHNKYPKIKIGGPVLCWPPSWPQSQSGSSPWYTWASWSQPLLDSGNLDFFDFHAYDSEAIGNVLEGEIAIVTAYSAGAHSKWIRSAITETSFTLTDTQWASHSQHFTLRALPLAKQTLCLLRHPDKVFARQIHDMYAPTWRIVGNSTLNITPVQELYGAMASLRGDRILVQENDPNLTVEAALNSQALVVAILNESTSSKTINLNTPDLSSSAVSSITGQVLDATSLRTLSVSFGSAVTLPAQSLSVIKYILTAARPATSILASQEYFANTNTAMTAVPVSQTLNYSITLPSAAVASASGATLCLGIKGPAASQNWTAQINNGTLVPVYAPGPYVEITLPQIPTAGTVNVTLHQTTGTKDVSDYVGFVSLKLTSTQSIPVTGDINGDGRVTLKDFSTLAANWMVCTDVTCP